MKCIGTFIAKYHLKKKYKMYKTIIIYIAINIYKITIKIQENIYRNIQP